MNKGRALCILLFGIATSLSLLSFPLPLHADAGVNLITSPLPVDLVARPGTSVTTELRIQNGGTATERLKVSLMKFAAYGEEGSPLLSDRGVGDDYFDWVSFSPTVFDAPPGQWQTVKMTIKLPKTAAFGYYYAVVFSRAAETKPVPGKSNAINGSTAVLVLLDAQVPNAKRELKLTSFTADRRFYEFLPADFSIKLHNNGNIHVRPFGSIFIKRGKKVVATLDANPGSGNILPNSNRFYEASWKDGFPAYAPVETNNKVATDKKGKPTKQLKWDFNSPLSKLRFGHYTATLAMAYDNGKGDVPLEASLDFWVVPWRLIGVVLALLIPSIFWFYRYRVLRRELKHYRKFKT